MATAGRHEAFGERCVMKSSKHATTVITTSSTVLFQLSKWDALKRLDKEFLTALMEAAHSSIDEEALKEQYMRSLQWDG